MNHVTELASPMAQAEPSRRRVLFGAVRFDLTMDFPDPGLFDEHALFVEHDEAGLVLAEVSAALHGAHLPFHDRGLEIERAWEGARGRASVLGVEAELDEVGSARFVARAAVSPDRIGVSSFVSALTSVVVERLGGVIVHAAGIELGGAALLFIGPSGAGKTTAANHCRDATWLARDRAAIVPTAEGYVTFGMPGGDEIGLPRASRAVRRLSGIARIRRDRPEVHVERLGASEAFSALRESTFGGGDVDAESRRMDALLALQATVPVVALHTRLGDPLDAPLREAFS